MPTWVGDVVMATPALRALRQRFPQAHLAVLVAGNARPVLDGHPAVDEVFTWRAGRGVVGRVSALWATARSLRRAHFDTVALLTNSFRSALLARMAGASRRVGYAREGRGWLLTHRLAPPRHGRRYAVVSAVHYYNAVAQRLGAADPGERLELATSPADEAAVAARLAAWGIGSRHPLVVVNPGASFGPSKLWLPERYGEVADRLIETHGASVVITFGPGERELAQRVRAAMRGPGHLVDDPPGTLGQLKVLIRRCDLLLGNDTGPRHFAKAFARRLVTVFGSTHPGWSHTDDPRERIVRIDLACSPCQQKVCPYGHHDCMRGVSSALVYAAAVELLGGYSPVHSLPVQPQTSRPG